MIKRMMGTSFAKCKTCIYVKNIKYLFIALSVYRKLERITVISLFPSINVGHTIIERANITFMF